MKILVKIIIGVGILIAALLIAALFAKKEKPFEGKALSSLAAESLSENQTKVKWLFNSGMKYPMNVMLLFL